VALLAAQEHQVKDLLVALEILLIILVAVVAVQRRLVLVDQELLEQADLGY
jgi:hypothetical protein